MKFPLAWHKQCLENQRRHSAGLLAQIISSLRTNCKMDPQ